jgi:hypothetical protein
MTDPAPASNSRPKKARSEHYVAGATIAIAVAGLGLSALFTQQAASAAPGTQAVPAVSPVTGGGVEGDDGGSSARTPAPVAVSGGS